MALICRNSEDLPRAWLRQTSDTSSRPHSDWRTHGPGRLGISRSSRIIIASMAMYTITKYVQCTHALCPPAPVLFRPCHVPKLVSQQEYKLSWEARVAAQLEHKKEQSIRTLVT